MLISKLSFYGRRKELKNVEFWENSTFGLIAKIKEKRFMHFTYEQRLALELYLKGSNLFPKTPNTHNLALLVKKGFKTFLMRTVRIALCE